MLQFLFSILDDNDRITAERLYNTYYSWMIVSAKSKLQGRSDIKNEAEAAVQTAFLKIIENFENFDFTRGEDHTKALLSVMAQNEAVNLTRKSKYHVELSKIEYMVSDEDFLEQIAIKTEYEQIKKAFNKLEHPYKTVLFLKFVEEKSVIDIANILKTNKFTVYKQLNKGKHMLLDLITEESDHIFHH